MENKAISQIKFPVSKGEAEQWFAEAEQSLLSLDPSGERLDATDVYETLVLFKDNLIAAIEMINDLDGRGNLQEGWISIGTEVQFGAKRGKIDAIVLDTATILFNDGSVLQATIRELISAKPIIKLK